MTRPVKSDIIKSQEKLIFGGMNMNSIISNANYFNLTSGAVGQYKNELSNEHLIILGDVMIRGRLKQIDGTVSEAKAHMPYFPSVDISQKDLKSFLNKGQVISEGTIRVLSRRQNIESGNVSLSICFSGAKDKFLRNFDEGTLLNNAREIESAIFDAGINVKPPRKANIDFIVMKLYSYLRACLSRLFTRAST